MKIIGFTYVSNSILSELPVTESINSILPLCDEFYVLVGKSEDNTANVIQRIDSPRLRIFQVSSIIAAELNGLLNVLSRQRADWLFYLKPSEIVHEKDLKALSDVMSANLHDPSVDGLLFNQMHFIGSYEYIGKNNNWNKQSVRILRPSADLLPTRGGEGFLKNNHPLNVKPTGIYLYNYRYISAPFIPSRYRMIRNQVTVSGQKNAVTSSEADFSIADNTKRFTGSHPAVMQSLISKVNWKFTFDPTKRKSSLRRVVKLFLGKLAGLKPAVYKTYRII
jgi:hypothetical protein